MAPFQSGDKTQAPQGSPLDVVEHQPLRRVEASSWESAWIAWLVLIVSVLVVGALSFRGWYPHDEGTLGLAAAGVLRGEVPHVDFFDVYGGLQAYVHAAAFSVLGESVFTLRVVGMLVAASGAFFAFRILRRALPEVPAALAAASTLVFGYLAYPASMPTWWNLVLGLAATDLLLTFFDRRGIRYLVLSGLAVGLGILVKSTGIFVLFALLAWMYSLSRRKPLGGWTFWAMFVGSTSFLAMIIVRSGSFDALFGLLLPWVLVWLLGWRWVANRLEPEPPVATDRRSIVVFVGAVVAPVLAFLGIYALSGHFSELWQGWVVLPTLRFSDVSHPLRVPPVILAMVLFGGSLVLAAKRLVPTWVLALGVSIAIVAYAFMTWRVFWLMPMGVTVNSSLVIVALLLAIMGKRTSMSSVSWAAVCFLSAFAFVQLPHSGMVYASYVMPAAVLAILLLAGRLVDVKWLTVALFLVAAAGLIQIGRGGLYVATPVQPFQKYTNFAVPRGGISIPEPHSYYQDLVEHLGQYEDEALYAGPDSPEVYFLLGALNPSGSFFEVLNPYWDPNRLPDFLKEHSIEAVVIKRDVPHSEPVPDEVLRKIGEEYPRQTRFGWFTVYERS